MFTLATFGLLFRNVTTTGVSPSLHPPGESVDLTRTVAMADGDGAGEADRVYSDESTVPISSAAAIDLSSYTDNFGQAKSMARAKLLYFRNTGTVNLTLTGTCPIVPAKVVRPGEQVLTCVPATDATGHAVGTVTVSNASGVTAGSYELVVIGASA